MRVDAIPCAVAAPPAASQHHPAGSANTAINTAISATCGPPPRKEDGPAAWTDADRAGVLNAENHEPLTEASAASVDRPGATVASAFPFNKAEATLAARLALAGWALQRAELTDHGAGYIATRWGRSTAVVADLAAVAAFADRVEAPQ